MVQKFTLETLEIEGFRGFNEKKSFQFNKPIVFLFGNNGLGKSSTLGAIEWCLFGDFVSVQCLETRTKDELINDINPKGIARVKLILKKDEDVYELIREKEKGTRRTKFVLKSLEGEFTENEAQEKCNKLLGTTLDDFHRTVFLHQESVRGLLTEETVVRDEAMDRLFGLDKIRNIIDNIPIRKIKEQINSLRNEKEKIEEKIKGAIENCELTLKKREKDAKEEGLSRNELNFNFATQLSKSLISDITKLAKQHKISLPEVTSPKELSEIKPLLTKSKSTLSECKKMIPEISEMDQLIDQKSDLSDLHGQCKRNATDTSKWKITLKGIERKYGNETKIKVNIKKAEKKVKDLDVKRKEISINARLLQDAIEYLEMTISDMCPVCGADIKRDKLISKLKKHVKETQRREMLKIDTEVKKAKSMKDLLERKLSEWGEASENLKGALKERDSLVEKVAERLEEKPRADVLKQLSKRILELNRKIKKLERRHKKREAQFRKAERKIDQLKALQDVLTTKKDLEEIKQIYSPEEEKKETLESEINELSSLEGDLNKIMRAAVKVQTSLATDIINKSSSNITGFYKKLTDHPYYTNLKIGVESKESRGYIKNSYSIKAFNPKEKKETLAVTRLSVGQMNCAALAIHLALSKILSHKLGFLIMDDPSQSLDTEHKIALVKLLKSIVPYNQVIISTHEVEFRDFLKSQLRSGEGRYVYEFINWSKSGPNFRVTK